MQQIIQLRPEDDIATIRARVENSDLSHVVLVVPRDCRALESERGLQLLRRAAEDSGVQLALVVHDEDIRDHARALGFPAFASLPQAQKTRWRMEPLSPEAWQHVSGGRLFVERQVRAPNAPPETNESPSAIVLAFMNAHRNFIAAFIAAILFLCIAAVLLVPAAQVHISPAAVGVSLTTDVLADPTTQQISSLSRIVPARRISREITGTAQLKTTTQRQVPNAPSTGAVTFTNQRSEETIIPQGTIVKTSAGVPIRFTTSTTATLPAGAGGRVDAPIQAVDPGPTGNVKELAINTIEGSLAIAARVINTKPTQSGTLKPVRVVTADDKKKLQDQLIAQLRQQGAETLKPEIKPDEFLAPDSVLIDPDDAVFDRAVDDPADVLNLQMNATVFGIAIDRDNLNTMVGAIVQKQMQAGLQLLPDGVQVEAQRGGKYEGIAFRMPFRGVGYTTPQVDVAKVSRALQGRTVGDASTYLADAIKLAQPPDINVTPMGWNRLPFLGFRIAVFVQTQPVKSK